MLNGIQDVAGGALGDSSEVVLSSSAAEQTGPAPPIKSSGVKESSLAASAVFHHQKMGTNDYLGLIELAPGNL